MEQYKIPSGEVTNIPLIEKIARLRKHVILSSGMSSWQELDRAVETVRRQHDFLTVLQCTSEYPCTYDHVGLNVMDEIRQRYGVEVGLSDHTRTTYAALAAVALGASIIEKHFTFSRSMYGSDAANSLEPAEFADMARGIRAIEEMLSNPVDKNDLASLRAMKETFEKSIVALVDIPAGERLRAEVLGIRKPGTGISAARWTEVVGKRTTRPISRNVPLTPADIAWNE
jgi:N-acetylneuraminate synthase